VIYEALLIEGTRWTPSYIFPQGSYTWTVRPVTATGFGAASAPGSFQIMSRPEALAPGGTIAGGGSLTFWWTAVSGATRYQVLIDKNGAPFASEWIDGATIWTSALTFTAGAYQWTVQPWNAEGFGLKSDVTEFLVPASGTIGLPAPLNPAGNLTGSGPLTFSWTAVSGVRWYRVTIEKDGQVLATQFLDNVTTWTPAITFGAGSYRWTVQSWKTTGFGTVSAPAVFAIAVSPPAKSVASGTAAAFADEGTSESTVATAFSAEVVRANGAGKGVSVSALTADSQQPASAITLAANSEPVVRAVLGMDGSMLVVPVVAANAFLTAEGTENGYDRDTAPATTGLAGMVSYPDSTLPGENGSVYGDATSPSGSATDVDSRQASLQQVESGGSGMGQPGETVMDLVSAQRGYIAPIDIVVGPMSDPGAKQASLTAKKLLKK
jgi:hypothetical protein